MTMNIEVCLWIIDRHKNLPELLTLSDIAAALLLKQNKHFGLKRLLSKTVS